MAVSLEGISISAACPVDVVTNQVVVMQGLADYYLVNRGSEDALADILVELVDSAGNRTTESHTNEQILAGERTKYSNQLFLQESYDRPGWVNVTMHVLVPGAIDGDQTADCNFIVNAPGLRASGIQPRSSSTFRMTSSQPVDSKLVLLSETQVMFSFSSAYATSILVELWSDDDQGASYQDSQDTQTDGSNEPYLVFDNFPTSINLHYRITVTGEESSENAVYVSIAW